LDFEIKNNVNEEKCYAITETNIKFGEFGELLQNGVF